MHIEVEALLVGLATEFTLSLSLSLSHTHIHTQYILCIQRWRRFLWASQLSLRTHTRTHTHTHTYTHKQVEALLVGLATERAVSAQTKQEVYTKETYYCGKRDLL
jgi:hypothetical protein